MTEAPFPNWMAEFDGRVTRFAEKDRVLAYVLELEALPQGRLTLDIDHGPPPRWERFLTGQQRVTTFCFAVEWYAGYASLLFFDDAVSEYRAVDRDAPVAPDEPTRRLLAHGELGPNPIDECLDKTRAFAAIRDYLINGEKPNWLTYKYVP